jgi:hypothetical protein
MRRFITIISIIGIFAAVMLALYLKMSLWTLLLLPLTFSTIFSLSVTADSIYWRTTTKELQVIKELEEEKNAYKLAKESLEQVGLLLGDILVDKKEDY